LRVNEAIAEQRERDDLLNTAELNTTIEAITICGPNSSSICDQEPVEIETLNINIMFSLRVFQLSFFIKYFLSQSVYLLLKTSEACVYSAKTKGCKWRSILAFSHSAQTAIYN